MYAELAACVRTRLYMFDRICAFMAGICAVRPTYGTASAFGAAPSRGATAAGVCGAFPELSCWDGMVWHLIGDAASCGHGSQGRETKSMIP